MEKDKIHPFIFKIGLISGIIILWELLANWISNPMLFPSIFYILSKSLPSIALFDGNVQAEYWGALTTIYSHSIVSLVRIFIGLSLGIILGISYGLTIHYFKRIQNGNAFILTLARNIPLFALIPIFLHWFGGREIGIHLYIAFAIFVIIATNTYEAVFNVPKAYIYQAKLLGATKYQIFRTVLFFAIQPEMVGSLRNVLGLSWAFSLGAEYLSARSGIGYLIYQSYLYADMGKLIVFAGIYVCYGIISFSLSNKMFKYVKRWKNI